jgi:hypothetical protein
MCYIHRMSTTPTDSLLPDKPQKNPDNDALGYAPFAKDLARAFIQSYSDPTSKVVGLVGEWGCGKTTIVNFVKDYLVNTPDHNITVMDYEPWLFGSQSDLISNFLNLLGNKLKSSILRGGFDPLFNKVRDYAKIIGLMTKSSNLKLGISPVELELNGSNFMAEVERLSTISLPDLKENISKDLKNKRLLVVIDDVDRLQPDQVGQICQLLKSVANFDNVHFLLPFDKAVLTAALDQLYKGKEGWGKEYLEKIIQIEFVIPKPTASKLEDYFEKSIAQYLPIDTANASEDESWQNFCYFYTTQLCLIFNNPRKIIRFVNAFSFAYSPLKEQLDWLDFMVLQIIKMECLEAYNFLYSKLSSPYGLSVLMERMDNGTGKIEVENFYQQFLACLNAITSQAKKNALIQCCQFLFPSSQGFGDSIRHFQKNDAIGCINNRNYTKNYFNLCFESEEISPSDLSLTLDYYDKPKELIDIIRRKCTKSDDALNAPFVKTYLIKIFDTLFNKMGISGKRELLANTLLNVVDNLYDEIYPNTERPIFTKPLKDLIKISSMETIKTYLSKPPRSFNLQWGLLLTLVLSYDIDWLTFKLNLADPSDRKLVVDCLNVFPSTHQLLNMANYHLEFLCRLLKHLDDSALTKAYINKINEILNTDEFLITFLIRMTTDNGTSFGSGPPNNWHLRFTETEKDIRDVLFDPETLQTRFKDILGKGLLADNPKTLEAVEHYLTLSNQA